MDAPIPLSFAQQTLWEEAQWCSGARGFHVVTSIHLEGIVDVPLLERCLTEIAERHQILRAVILDDDDPPAQRFSSHAGWTLPVVSFEDLPPAERWHAAERFAAIDATRPFELSTGPLFRGTLLRLAPEEHIVFLVVHHLLIDGLSKAILQQELAALYAAYSERRPSPLPSLPFQYADYVLWQRERLRGEAFEELFSFWAGRVTGIPRRGRATPRDQNGRDPFAKARRSFTFSPAFRHALRTLTRREGVTRFMALLWALTVWIRVQRDDAEIVVAAEMANRLRLETEPLIGLFADMSIFRTGLEPGLTRRDSLRRVRRAALDVYAHQEMPLMLLLETVRARLGRGHFRCDAFLNVRPWPRFTATTGRLGWRGVVLVPEDFESPLDLNVIVKEDGDVSHATVLYNPDAYDVERIDTMECRLERFVAGIIDEPGAPMECWS
jgi:condensation domain-containing protein